LAEFNLILGGVSPSFTRRGTGRFKRTAAQKRHWFGLAEPAPNQNNQRKLSNKTNKTIKQNKQNNQTKQSKKLKNQSSSK
jgi:hypothetical protein